MNVIAKISRYLERSDVTLELRKEYLNTVTHNTPVFLRIKYLTIWYIERYSMSTYTGVTNCQKTVRFFWPTLYVYKICPSMHPSSFTWAAISFANVENRIRLNHRHTFPAASSTLPRRLSQTRCTERHHWEKFWTENWENSTHVMEVGGQTNPLSYPSITSICVPSVLFSYALFPPSDRQS